MPGDVIVSIINALRAASPQVWRDWVELEKRVRAEWGARRGTPSEFCAVSEVSAATVRIRPRRRGGLPAGR